MAKPDEKSKALKLRKRGYSIKDIADIVGVSKGTVSVWCKDVVLSDSQINVLRNKAIKAGHQGRMKGAQMNKSRKLEAIDKALKEAQKEVGNISRRDLLILGIALYWAEGSKSSNRCIFVNSDPEMILLMKIFFIEIFEIDFRDINITIQINVIHKPRIEKVLHFWQTLLQLPREQFTKVYYIKTEPKKRYENHNSYYGIARIIVRRSSSVQYKMLGYTESLKGRGSSIG